MTGPARPVIGRRLLLAGTGAGLSACSPADLLNATVSDRGVTLTKDVRYGPGPRHTLDIYRPAAMPPSPPLVVFIYGGSWRSGNKDLYGFVGEPLARRGVIVVIPDYRLYPEVAFPTFLEDNAQAVRWALAEAAGLGADPRRVSLLGHSAGAYNVAMLALDRRWLGADRARIDRAIGLAGPYDFLPITDPEVIPVFAPVQDGPASQPITYVDGTNPPMFLAAGSADQTVNPGNTRRLAARIRERGGFVEERIYPDVGHIGLITAFAPLFQHAAPVLDDVRAFLRPAGSAAEPAFRR